MDSITVGICPGERLTAIPSYAPHRAKDNFFVLYLDLQFRSHCVSMSAMLRVRSISSSSPYFKKDTDGEEELRHVVSARHVAFTFVRSGEPIQ